MKQGPILMVKTVINRDVLPKIKSHAYYKKANSGNSSREK